MEQARGALAGAPVERPAGEFLPPLGRSDAAQRAAACDGRVLVAILTGMGSDGLAGTRRVIEAGGTAIAQDEATSVVWGMPGAVAQAGLCNAVLPLPRIAAKLLELLRMGHRMSTAISAAAFGFLADLLRSRSGLVIGQDKIYLLETRLAPILKREKLRDLNDLVDRLRGRGADAVARDVVEAMTTNESFFFRDDKPFQHFRAQALARVVAARPAPASRCVSGRPPRRPDRRRIRWR